MSEPKHGLMTNSIRGQIIFRHAQGSPKGFDRAFGAPTSQVPFSYYLAAGILEADEGELPDEKVIDFLIDRRDRGMSFQLMGRGRALPPESAISDLGGVMTQMEVEAPFLGALLICGGMVLRKTRMPSAEGKVTYAIAALVRSPVDIIPEREMFSFLGNSRSLALFNPNPVPESFEEGSTPTQTYGLPIWGFDTEPRAFRSTLPLPVIDVCSEIRAIEMSRTQTDAQKERLEQLYGNWLADPVKWNRKDERFEEFKRRMFERGGYQPMDTYPAAAECAAHEGMVSEVVREMLEQEDELIAPSM